MSTLDGKRFFVYVSYRPRAVALVPVNALSNSAGTFLSVRIRQDNQSRSEGEVKVEITIERVSTHLQFYSPLDMDAIYGCAGIIDYQSDTYIFLITRCQYVCNLTELTKGQPSKPVFRVVQVTALSLTDSIFDSQAYRRMPGAMYDEVAQGDMDIYGITNPCTQMTNFLENGAFFFSPAFDITRNLQSQQLRSIVADDPHICDPDIKFQWNSSMLQVFTDYCIHMCGTSTRQQFESAGYTVSLIQGAVESIYLPQGVGAQSNGGNSGAACFLISRSSSMRSGMRFLTRGVDDEGGVANEVETEVMLVTPSLTMAHVQVRGSVPVFWTQEGLQIGSHKVRITRSAKATLPATKRHFSDLLSRYRRVNVISLLKQHSVPGDYGGVEAADPDMIAHGVGTSEADLGRFYKVMIDAMGLPKSLVSFSEFDYNHEVRGGQFDRVHILIRSIAPLLSSFKYFLVDNDTGTILTFQRGVQRTNCIDCLDRTNVVQSVISRGVITEFLRQNNVVRQHMLNTVIDGVGRLWAANGNAISRSYTGTGALKSDVTTSGKSGWAGFLSDASKSISRLMQNNFQDRGKQSVIDLLLGSGNSGLLCRPVVLYDPYESIIAPQLDRELNKIARKTSIHVMLCTYNLHGSPYRGESLGTWLEIPQGVRPDIVAVGFQEVVNLDMQSVISADTANRRIWEQVLTTEINAQYRKSFGSNAEGEYALVSSEQLVGVVLLLFAHDTALPHVHNVQMVKYKTGMAGMTGNKGCVAMHMMFDDTSICIISAHLTAGPSKVNERNNDYHTIRTGTRFQHGRYIDSHDYTFWLGDLNYRLNLPNERVRSMIAQNQLQELLKYDQLKSQIAADRVFQGYSEAEIRFPPTYKYDSGTTTYDTSEKMRVPSWTDRIMFRGRNIRVLRYYRDEISFSDHKPVMALMQFDVMSIDKEHKQHIIRQLYKQFHESGAVSSGASSQTRNANVQRLIDVDVTGSNYASDQSTKANSITSVDGLASQPRRNAAQSNSSTDNRSFINPFATTTAAVQISRVSPKMSADNLANQKPLLIDADPFADDDGIPWKPLAPL
ncbi:Inositol-1,4,5-trisphosphate 5-phosphatase 1 [Coemansia sp. RSA 1086]|nr:Inositol-1,4,5-trisphosphate 5-phosphatase 1 [Coemansia sp. RSA 1086]